MASFDQIDAVTVELLEEFLAVSESVAITMYHDLIVEEAY